MARTVRSSGASCTASVQGAAVQAGSGPACATKASDWAPDDSRCGCEVPHSDNADAGAAPTAPAAAAVGPPANGIGGGLASGCSMRAWLPPGVIGSMEPPPPLNCFAVLLGASTAPGADAVDPTPGEGLSGGTAAQCDNNSGRSGRSAPAKPGVELEPGPAWCASGGSCGGGPRGVAAAAAAAAAPRDATAVARAAALSAAAAAAPLLGIQPGADARPYRAECCGDCGAEADSCCCW